MLELVKQGHFREDLYYRLNVVPLVVPPLRVRREDILPLATYYLKKFNLKYGQEKILSAGLIDVMEKYNWPGNVRELMNVLERMLVTTEGNILHAENFPLYDESPFEGQVNTPIVRREHLNGDIKKGNLDSILEKTEKAVLTDVLNSSRTTTVAAERLGISRSTLARKMRRYGLKRR